MIEEPPPEFEPLVMLDDHVDPCGGRGRPGDGDPDLRQLRRADGRAEVQAHLSVRLLHVLLRLLLIRAANGVTG